MPVNNFEFEKADGIITSIKGQSVGRDPISAAGVFNFVSIAQKGFGYEPEEEDMIKVMHGEKVGDVLQFDLKNEDVADLLDNGALIYFFDADNEFNGAAASVYYLMGVGERVDTWRIATIETGGNPISYELSTDADGYLYFYFD